jgi:UDP-N-acetylmuramyl pentapeptide phosphotransferase/UDP-N-acetylglucosamine-1-phosphate transferase
MTMTSGFLAGAFRIGEENAIRALIPAGSTVVQVVIYAGALLVVALAVFGWAVFLRRQRRHRRHSHHHHHHSKSASRHHQSPEAPSRFRTLAETGGLPPVRSQQPPPDEGA